MPFVEVTSSTGKTKFKYTICTPSSEEAKEIDAGLPTILFLHPVSLAEYLFTGQFSDQQLRRCNLVSFDLRGHGNTFGDSAPCDYGQVEAAEDTIQLMNSLNLPPCHLVGVSSGTIIALQLAVTQPQRILSMFLISQSCTEMPAEVAGGHHEILDLWTCAFPDKTTTLPELISDAEFGQRQYLFTEPKLSPLVDAILSLTSKVAKKRWCYPFLDQYRILNHDFNVNRSSTSQMALAQITSPIILAYGSGDVAYPQIYTEQFLHELLEAGVDASLLVIKNAPHCMIPDYSKKLNPIIYEFVTRNDTLQLAPYSPWTINLSSPWNAALKEAGPGGETDSWDDTIIIHKYGLQEVREDGSLDSGGVVLDSFLDLTLS